MSLEKVKPLKLWNGRIYDYEHGYIAAHSVADAARVAKEHLPTVRITPHEISVYWHANAWGNRMIGITPERGLWVEKKKTREIVRIVNGKEFPVTRGPEWEEFQAKQQAEREAAERDREKAREEKRERLNELWIELGVVDALHSLGCNGQRISFEYRGHKFEVAEKIK